MNSASARQTSGTPPPYIFEALGCVFNLDVASPGAEILPWIPAVECLTRDSLKRDWHGFVWMNAPFGRRNGLIPWLDKFIDHADGIALVPDRTSAPWWQVAAPKMDMLLFVAPKIRFIGADGEPGTSPAQGTTLMALGDRGVSALRRAASSGLGSIFSGAS